jgi:hypothetical protein
MEEQIQAILILYIIYWMRNKRIQTSETGEFNAFCIFFWVPTYCSFFCGEMSAHLQIFQLIQFYPLSPARIAKLSWTQAHRGTMWVWSKYSASGWEGYQKGLCMNPLICLNWNQAVKLVPMFSFKTKWWPLR